MRNPTYDGLGKDGRSETTDEDSAYSQRWPIREKRTRKTPRDNTLFDTSLPGAFDTRARVEKSG